MARPRALTFGGSKMPARRKKSIFYTRGFAVFVLVYAALVLTVSGVVLYITPPGRYTNWVDWRVLSITKSGWEAIHINFSLLFVLLLSLHIYFNWRVLKGYLRRGVAWTVRYRWELLAATLLTALVFAGSVLEWPVFSDIVAFGEEIKAQIEGHQIVAIASWQAAAGLLLALLAGWGILIVRSLPLKEEIRGGQGS